MTGGAGALPPHAYVPGQTPRHPEGAFDAIRGSAHAGMTPAELARSAAFERGLAWLDAGYYWEAHEVLEPVWMALPEGGAERALVQGLIQLANARLKARMERPNAVRRLRAMASGHLRDAARLGGAAVMGVAPAAYLEEIESLGGGGGAI